MSKKNAGFTLIEVMLVMSVTGLLLYIALVGQHQLQARARFDSSIDHVLQDFAYARNFSQSNVNEPGGGNDTNSVIAGDGIEFDNHHFSHNFPLVEIENIYAAPDSNGYPDMSTLDDCPLDLKSGSGPWTCGCPASLHPDDVDECQENFADLPDDLTLDAVNGIPYSPSLHAIAYYVNTAQGLKMCQDFGSGAWQSIHAACAAGISTPVTLTLKDSEGFTAQIQFDGVTGYAKRL